jgi:hypothetical protein
MLDYLLGNAVGNNHIRRAGWLLEHGARATATHAYSKRPVHTEAVLGGFTELAELLVRHGAKPEPLNDVYAFQAACMTCDREAAQRLLAAHPELVRFPGPMYVATEGDRVDVVELLLALGVSPDVEHGHWTALHAAAHNTSVRVAELLIAQGASIDIREDKYHATPLGHAVYMRRDEMVEILSRVSRDVVSLVRAGRLERLREVLDAEPGLIGTTHQGRTLLFFLAAPEERAIEIAELLLARGADPAFKDADGMTAADAASKLGFDDVASLLRD